MLTWQYRYQVKTHCTRYLYIISVKHILTNRWLRLCQLRKSQMLYKDDISLLRYQLWRTTRHHYNMKSLFYTAILLVVFSIVQGMYMYVLQHVHILDLNLSKYWKQTCIRQSTERIEYKSVKVFLLWYFFPGGFEPTFAIELHWYWRVHLLLFRKIQPFIYDTRRYWNVHRENMLLSYYDII